MDRFRFGEHEGEVLEEREFNEFIWAVLFWCDKCNAPHLYSQEYDEVHGLYGRFVRELSDSLKKRAIELRRKRLRGESN